MIDYVVLKLIRIIGEGGTNCNYARTEILDIIHTYEVPNMFDEFDKLEEE